MGCISSDTTAPIEVSGVDSSKILTVATLNYCGIMNSPFEFYCDDYLSQLKQIGKTFLQIIPHYFPQFDQSNFKWNMGKIDLKYRNRYSPMFTINAGLKEDKTFMSQEQFQKAWQDQFKAEIAKVKIEYTEEQKEVTKKYDVAMFHTLLRYVYGIKQLQQATSKSSQEYVEKLSPLYGLSFLDEDRKCAKVLANFSRIDADVFFFQEYSQNFYEAVKKTDNYYLMSDFSKDTLIVAKKSSFEHKPANNDVFFDANNMDADFIKRLNWNDRSAFMVIDKFIFINAHLSSKAESNKKQIDGLRQAIVDLKSKLPSYDIVLAGDLNSYLQPFGQLFSFFPPGSEEMTTVKKRTFTQGQYNKADKVVRESKDKILSNLKLLNGKISYITGAEPSSQNLVPTDEHPFDHFVVVASFQKKISDI